MKEKTKEEKEKVIEEVSEKVKKEQNKILKLFLMVMGLFVVAVVVWLVISYNQAHFKYMEVDFDVVDEIAPYRTGLASGINDPITGAVVEKPFYFYIRNDPRQLDKIPFEGNLVFLRTMVINSSEDFMCEGKGIIGVTNLAQLYRFMGTDVVKDKNVGCDSQGRYMFLQIESGNETRIDEIGSACYSLKVSNCEILEVTERFMTETFVRVGEIIRE